MFRDADEVFLIMERAPGMQLDAVWPSLTETEKCSVTAKLGDIFDSLRQVECPWPDFFGGLGGGSLRHYLFYSQKGDCTHLGPFRGEAAFVGNMVVNFRALVERKGRADFKVRFYEEYLAQALGDFRPTLTHGDVQKKNIIIAEIEGGQGNGERDFDFVLVDWEMAGWYPDFWEFFCASSTFDFVYWEEEWCWCAQQMLQVKPAELAMMRMFDKDMAL
jgi:hypothetical protein